MEKVVVDTSVVVKWFLEEDGSLNALKLRDSHQKGEIEICAPEVISLELANALYYSGYYRKNALESSLKAFYSLDISLVGLSFETILNASRVMEKFDIAVYDSLFISLAETEGVWLITADIKHHQKGFSDSIKYLNEI